MKYRYFIYYKRVYCGKTVGQGNKSIELDNTISMEDISKIESELDKEAKEYSDSHITMSMSIVINFIKF